MIQHLHEIIELNHVHDDLSSPNSFYGGLLHHLSSPNYFYWGLLESYYRGEETKIKVESEEHVLVMEDEIGKKTI